MLETAYITKFYQLVAYIQALSGHAPSSATLGEGKRQKGRTSCFKTLPVVDREPVQGQRSTMNPANHSPVTHPLPFWMAPVLPLCREQNKLEPLQKPNQPFPTETAGGAPQRNARSSFYLAFSRFLALSSQCSDTVRSSCSFAIAFSTAG